MLWILVAFSLLFVFACIFGLWFLFLDCDLELAFYERFGKSIHSMRGKVVFITGASSGIGEHSAYAFAKHGVKLILTARRKYELERVKQRCLELSNSSLSDDDILPLEMDMCNLSSHKILFDRAIEHFGHVDVLFNNAGRSQRAIWENIDISVDKDLFELNVFSLVNLTRVALAHFNERGQGHIAATSSIAGIFGVAYSASYTGSKHALHGYMNALRNEKCRSGITVSLVCPGPVFTNFLENSFTEKSGEKFGTKVQRTDHRMTAERCGELCAINIANKLNESWMALFPLLPLIYCSVYFPKVSNFISKIVGPKALHKLRDSGKLES